MPGIRSQFTGQVTIYPFKDAGEPHSWVKMQRLSTSRTNSIYDTAGFFPGSKKKETMARLDRAVRAMTQEEMVEWGADSCDCRERRQRGEMPPRPDGLDLPCGFFDLDKPDSNGGFAVLAITDETKERFLDNRLEVDGEEIPMFTHLDNCLAEKLGERKKK